VVRGLPSVSQICVAVTTIITLSVGFEIIVIFDHSASSGGESRQRSDCDSFPRSTFIAVLPYEWLIAPRKLLPSSNLKVNVKPSVAFETPYILAAPTADAMFSNPLRPAIEPSF